MRETRRLAALWRAGVVASCVLGLTSPARAADVGFIQDFNSGDTGFFESFALLTPMASGGVGGADDGYLQTERLEAGNLGAHSTIGMMTGDLIADGVTGYSFYLRDTGGDDNHEVHVGVGEAFVNFWLTVDGFEPPDGEWQQFSVDVTDESQWVQIDGAGTFEEALQASDRLLFRHDVPPLVLFPQTVTGEFGIDRVEVLGAGGEPTGVPMASPGSLLGLIAVIALVAGLALRGRSLRSA